MELVLDSRSVLCALDSLQGVHGDLVVGSTEKLLVNHSDDGDISAQWPLLVVVTSRAAHTECGEVNRIVSVVPGSSPV